jgi:hypothetical protein
VCLVPRGRELPALCVARKDSRLLRPGRAVQKAILVAARSAVGCRLPIVPGFLGNQVRPRVTFNRESRGYPATGNLSLRHRDLRSPGR